MEHKYKNPTFWLWKNIVWYSTGFDPRPFTIPYLCQWHASSLWWWIVSVVWLTDERRFALFPARTIVRDPHIRESPTRREQDLNLRRTFLSFRIVPILTNSLHFDWSGKISDLIIRSICLHVLWTMDVSFWQLLFKEHRRATAFVSLKTYLVTHDCTDMPKYSF